MTDQKKEIKIRLSDKVFELLKNQAEELGMTRSSYITHLILLREQEKQKD